MKNIIAITALAGLLAAGCASRNTGGTSETQTQPSYGSSSDNMGTGAPATGPNETGTPGTGGLSTTNNQAPVVTPDTSGTGGSTEPSGSSTGGSESDQGTGSTDLNSNQGAGETDMDSDEGGNEDESNPADSDTNPTPQENQTRSL